MYRLIIVDDEHIIRETISGCVDWNKIDIEIIGICRDGMEAYDMIVNTPPDIVLTDIHMPILSGLKLIEQVSKLNLSIEFVILSAYSDFTFATEAMKYGVQHYLLKPCKTEQIISTMQKVVAKCHHKYSLLELQNKHKNLTDLYEKAMIAAALIATLSHNKSLQQVIKVFPSHTNIYNAAYTQYQFSALNPKDIDSIIKRIMKYQQSTLPSIYLFYLYTEDKLTIFYKTHLDMNEIYEHLNFLSHLACTSSNKHTKIISHNSLYHLLDSLIDHFKLHNLIYFIYNDDKFPIYNYPAIDQKYNMYFSSMAINKLDKSQLCSLLKRILDIDNFTLAKSLIANYILKNYFEYNINYTSTEMLELITSVNACETSSQVYGLLKPLISAYYGSLNTPSYKDFIQRILDYIDTNYSDPHLTLKWIAENYLYMNVDYVSRQFSKQLGIRFSTYLSKIRIEKAKELLLEQGCERIYDIAKLTGFSNNPQYFSQAFKRHTGMTPTEFINKPSNFETITT